MVLLLRSAFVLFMAGVSLLGVTRAAAQPAPGMPPPTQASAEEKLAQYQRNAPGWIDTIFTCSALSEKLQAQVGQLTRERDEALAKLQAQEQPKDAAAKGTN